MTPSRRIASAIALCIVSAACSPEHTSEPTPSPENPGSNPPQNPGTNSPGPRGNLEITVTTSGPDQYPNGYASVITGPTTYGPMGMPANGSRTITEAGPGDFTIILYGLADNCTLSGQNPRRIALKEGENGKIAFEVTCIASGSLKITTVTIGVDPDADGFLMLDRDRSSRQGDHSHSFTPGLDTYLPPNGTTIASALRPGTYGIEVRDVAPNCTTPAVAGELVTIVAGVEATLTLEVVCSATSLIAFVRGAGEFEWETDKIALKDIYVANSNGTGIRRLTSAPGADINPAWSPDRKKIAFASDRAGNREIYIMNSDGSEQVRLTNHPAPDYSPAYSPDGKKIAFVSERDGNAEIYLMDADGTNVTRLTNNSRADLDPAWSPDGSKIAFSRDGGIYLMRADGTGEVQLTNRGDTQPAWSPDGNTIAFRSTGRQYESVWLMNTDGSAITRFLDANYSRANPEWSPDGTHIAFDDRDCWDSGPCPRGIVIGTIEGSFSGRINDASEPSWTRR